MSHIISSSLATLLKTITPSFIQHFLKLKTTINVRQVPLHWKTELKRQWFVLENGRTKCRPGQAALEEGGNLWHFERRLLPSS